MIIFVTRKIIVRAFSNFCDHNEHQIVSDLKVLRGVIKKNAIFTSSVILTRTNVITTLTTVISTRTRVISTRRL
jgi:hypothetical protein